MLELICRYNKFGYCKFGNHCFRKHENLICENAHCNLVECPLRHPRKCKFFLEFHYCKFGVYCKFSHEKIENTSKQIDELKQELKILKQEIQEKVKIINEKDSEIKAMIEKHVFEIRKVESEDLKEFEAMREDRNVTQMLFDDFKEEMTYKYGYDSSAETSDEELVQIENNCNFCEFKGKTAGGLKSHVTKKHKDKDK